MGKFAYRGPAIESLVPVVHAWLGPAVRSWTRFMYPGRRRFWFAWGWVLLVVVLWIAAKVTVYWAVVLLMTVAFAVTALFDLVSYPLRKRAAGPAPAHY